MFFLFKITKVYRSLSLFSWTHLLLFQVNSCSWAPKRTRRRDSNTTWTRRLRRRPVSSPTVVKLYVRSVRIMQTSRKSSGALLGLCWLGSCPFQGIHSSELRSRGSWNSLSVWEERWHRLPGTFLIFSCMPLESMGAVFNHLMCLFFRLCFEECI